MLHHLRLALCGSWSAALVILLISASPAVATCFGGGNEGAWGSAASQSGTQVVAARGVRAEFLLRPAVPNNDGTAIAHPSQVVSTTTSSVDFLGLGTYKSGSQATPPGCSVNAARVGKHTRTGLSTASIFVRRSYRVTRMIPGCGIQLESVAAFAGRSAPSGGVSTSTACSDLARSPTSFQERSTLGQSLSGQRSPRT